MQVLDWFIVIVYFVLSAAIVLYYARRAGILTDVEFVEVRYDGRAAAFLRGFRALYLGVFMNCIIMAWVNVAMGAILEGMFDIPHDKVILYVVLAMLITAGYSAASGMWGVAVTDAVQFVLAMTGTIVLAIFVLDLPAIGGIRSEEHTSELQPQF